MVDYLTNKKHIYKWRDNNLDKYRLISRKHKQKRDLWLKEKKSFLKILLD
jgi:hypothetical protein